MNIRVASAISVLCLIWGYLWVAIKINLQYFPPVFYTSLRLLGGGLCLLIIQLLRRKSIMPDKKDWPKIGFLSVLMCVGYYGLSTFGMEYVDSGLSAIFVYTMPIIISVLAHFYIQEKLTKQKVIGLIIGFTGMLSILWPQLVHLDFNATLMGELIIITSAFCWACSTLYIKKEFATYDKIKLNLWQLLMGGIVILIASSFTENLHHIEWAHTTNLLYVAYSGILATGIGMALWNWIVSQINASIASVSIMVVPLLGLLFGHLQLGEVLGTNILIGAILICAGIFCCSFTVKVLIKKDKVLNAN